MISYRVRNLHGYYNRFYWESSTSEESNSCDEKGVHAGEKINQPGRNEKHSKVEQIQRDLESFQKNGQKSEQLQGFQNPNNVFNYSLTTYQQPTKVVGMVVGSDALVRNPRVEETAHAPLRGASPSRIESASELEELPVATDCTTLALVDDAPSQLAPLLAEKQDCGVEAAVSHQGACSAAPIAQNKFSDKEAIANQTQGQAEQSNSASLSRENQVSGFDFLQQCCHDDPALQIVIKKLLAKFPQWGIAIVDGVLVKCG